jgi:hypothetical protein
MRWIFVDDPPGPAPDERVAVLARYEAAYLMHQTSMEIKRSMGFCTFAHEAALEVISRAWHAEHRTDDDGNEGGLME